MKGCRKTMRTLNRKQSLLPDAGPCNGVLDELAMKKQAVLVVSKIRKGRAPSVSFGPESQYGVACRYQLALDCLRDRSTEEGFCKGENDHRRFRHPSQFVNAVRKPYPK
jgi:hypothetical protein